MVYKVMGAVRARVLQNPYPPATPITATVYIYHWGKGYIPCLIHSTSHMYIYENQSDCK